MASKGRFSTVSPKGSMHQFLLMQMLETGGKRRHPRLPVARELLLVLTVGGAVLLILMLMLSLVY